MQITNVRHLTPDDQIACACACNCQGGNRRWIESFDEFISLVEGMGKTCRYVIIEEDQVVLVARRCQPWYDELIPAEPPKPRQSEPTLLSQMLKDGWRPGR